MQTFVHKYLFDFPAFFVDKHTFFMYNHACDKHLFGMFVRSYTHDKEDGVMHKRNFVRILVFGLLAFFIIFGGVIVHNNRITANSQPREKIFTSIPIHSGDSLWSIASRYCDSPESIPSYVEDLKQMNSIANERSLIAGRYLTIYYWEEADFSLSSH